MEMLEASINKYHNKVITAVEVIDELIGLSKHIVAHDNAAKELGLSEYEAWGMTMTGYRAAVRAKTPPDERNEKRKPNVHINKRDYDEQMEAAKRVLELMKKREQEKARN